MPKAPAHPLDPLFRAKLRDISWSQFQVMEKALAAHPKPWRWPDPKTGVQWTLMGRKADLLWNAGPTHSIRNHTTTCHAIQEAVRNNEAWHESVAGKPDILVMWLGTMREGVANGKTQNALARALKDRKAGLGKPGDGGYLDQVLALVEEETRSTTDPDRRYTLHHATSKKWLSGNLLATTNPGAAGWRAVINETLPMLWPIDTIERVVALARANEKPDTSIFFMANDGPVLVQQLQGSDVSERMLGLLAEDFLAAPGQAPHGALMALEHYQSRGATIDPRVIHALGDFVDAPFMWQFPQLKAAAIEHTLHADTTASSPRQRPQTRL